MVFPKMCTESKCFLPCVGLSGVIAIHSQMITAITPIIRVTLPKIISSLQKAEDPSPEVGNTKCAQRSSLVSIYSSIQSCSLMSFKRYIGLIYIITYIHIYYALKVTNSCIGWLLHDFSLSLLQWSF